MPTLLDEPTLTMRVNHVTHVVRFEGQTRDDKYGSGKFSVDLPGDWMTDEVVPFLQNPQADGKLLISHIHGKIIWDDRISEIYTLDLDFEAVELQPGTRTPLDLKVQFCDPWPPAGSFSDDCTLLSISLDEATLIADAYTLWLHGSGALKPSRAVRAGRRAPGRVRRRNCQRPGAPVHGRGTPASTSCNNSIRIGFVCVACAGRPRWPPPCREFVHRSAETGSVPPGFCSDTFMYPTLALRWLCNSPRLRRQLPSSVQHPRLSRRPKSLADASAPAALLTLDGPRIGYKQDETQGD